MSACDTHLWIRQAAAAIHEGFVNYNNNFRRITHRARARFESRDWAGARNDLSERIELYEKSVSRTLGTLRKLFPEQVDLLPQWPAIRAIYWSRVEDIPDGEFAKTFFNSVHRDILRDLHVDPTQVSDTADVVAAEAPLRYPARQHNYVNWSNVREIVARLLADFQFKTPYVDVEADVDFVCAEIERVVGHEGPPDECVRRLEMMHDMFYQSSRAFVVGKMFWATRNAPFVLAFENTSDGIRVEAVLTSSDDVSVLFGFTRSYFMVDVEPVEGAVYFIKEMMPRKPLDELYTILGRARQGKTERYRSFFHHLRGAEDQFIHAAGDRGLVMLVFTLPSYDLVFKVIRDSFGYTKNISHDGVKTKYKFVFNHDRAGRLIDTQEFRNIEFPLAKFAPELIEELLSSTAQTVRIEGDQLVIDHLYSERRVTPLNLYLQDYHFDEARLALLDYGQAIKDLAMTNIFAGDLLLKNFGVSRHGRVIFYDYDELCLVTECQFRDLPTSDNLDDEMSAENWFYVGPRDIFPEEFIRFLAISDQLRAAFLEQHADLLTADYWRGIKELHLSNCAPEVAPYYRLGTRRITL